jgi:hypothetical protein
MDSVVNELENEMNARQMAKAEKEAKVRALGFGKATMLRDMLYDNWSEACARYKAFADQFPKGPMNLTPDFVKAMPEYAPLRAACANTEATYKNFASVYNRVYKKEIAADVRARQASRQTKVEKNERT